MNPTKQHEIPKVSEYCKLREVCGLSVISEEAAEKGLPQMDRG